MNPTLTEEQRSALESHPEGIELEDARTHRLYVLTDAGRHRRAMDALRRLDDFESVARGLADAEAGRTLTPREAEERIRGVLGFPPAA